MTNPAALSLTALAFGKPPRSAASLSTADVSQAIADAARAAGNFARPSLPGEQPNPFDVWNQLNRYLPERLHVVADDSFFLTRQPESDYADVFVDGKKVGRLVFTFMLASLVLEALS